MPNQAGIQAHVAHGYAVAAAKLGAPVTQIRPIGPLLPLQQPPHATLLAVFDQDPSFSMKKPWDRKKAEGFVQADSSDLLVGDLLVGVETYAVERFEPIRPVGVFLCNHTVSIALPTKQPSAGSADYGGRTDTSEQVFATGWPCSILTKQKGDMPPTHVPSDIRAAWYEVLLPNIPEAEISPGDILTDEAANDYEVSTSESTQFGWRLLASVLTA